MPDGALTAHGDVAYVVGQQGAGPIAPSLDVFAATRPVRHESLPCAHGQAYVPFAPLGVSTDGLVYLVCDVMTSQPSPPAQTQLAYESVTEGSSWRAGHPPPPQPPQGVTAVPGERFAWNSGPDLYKLTGHGWHVSLTGRGHGFSLVGFETDRHRLVRQLRVVRGTMRFVMDFQPRFDNAPTAQNGVAAAGHVHATLALAAATAFAQSSSYRARPSCWRTISVNAATASVSG